MVGSGAGGEGGEGGEYFTGSVSVGKVAPSGDDGVKATRPCERASWP